MPSLTNRIGELFISGYLGDDPGDDFIRQVSRSSLGGVILFAENCNDHQKLRETIEILQAESPRRLFVAIDQEGGRVCRLRGAPVEYLSAERYGHHAEQSAEALQLALAEFRTDFSMAAEYMSQLGINLLLAPVCDLRPAQNIPLDSTALNERTFSAAPEVVGAFAKLTVELAHEYGLLCCLKHAPGLGSVVADPHIALGASPLGINRFRERDLLPFRAGCIAGADLIMTSHFLIPELDSAPVTYSEKIITTLIKEELSAEIALITDDLDMGALRDLAQSGSVCLAALGAGHDIMLARSNDTVVREQELLTAELESGAASEALLTTALEQVDILRSKLEQ